jgi:hypothetical protein
MRLSYNTRMGESVRVAGNAISNGRRNLRALTRFSSATVLVDMTLESGMSKRSAAIRFAMNGALA